MHNLNFKCYMHFWANVSWQNVQTNHFSWSTHSFLLRDSDFLLKASDLSFEKLFSSCLGSKCRCKRLLLVARSKAAGSFNPVRGCCTAPLSPAASLLRSLWGLLCAASVWDKIASCIFYRTPVIAAACLADSTRRVGVRLCKRERREAHVTVRYPRRLQT